MNGAMSLQELTDKLQEPKTSLYRVILTLEHHGYLNKTNNQEYEVGERVLSLSTNFLLDNNLKKAAQNPMQQLFLEHKDTVNLGILSGSEVVYIDIVESNFSLKMTDSIGSRSPAHATGLGKAILSHIDESALNDLLNNAEFFRYTTKTLLDRESLLKELNITKERGYALDDEEVVEGARCIAAPIFDFNKRVLGAISISGPIQRFSRSSIEEIARNVMSAAEEISRSLGHFKQKRGTTYK